MYASEKGEAQKSYEICLRSHSWEVEELGVKLLLFLMIWPRTVWIGINRPPRLRGKLMSQSLVSDLDDSNVLAEFFRSFCILKHFCLFGGKLSYWSLLLF